MLNKGYKIIIEGSRWDETEQEFLQRMEDDGYEILCQYYQYPNITEWVFAKPK